MLPALGFEPSTFRLQSFGWWIGHPKGILYLSDQPPCPGLVATASRGPQRSPAYHQFFTPFKIVLNFQQICQLSFYPMPFLLLKSILSTGPDMRRQKLSLIHQHFFTFCEKMFFCQMILERKKVKLFSIMQKKVFLIFGSFFSFSSLLENASDSFFSIFCFCLTGLLTK